MPQNVLALWLIPIHLKISSYCHKYDHLFLLPNVLLYLVLQRHIYLKIMSLKPKIF